MWKEVKKESAQYRDIYNAFMWAMKRHGKRDIFQAYNTPSPEKVSIYREWEQFANDHNGFITVVTKNTFVFTLAIIFTDENEENHFCYITPTKNIDVNIGKTGNEI